MELQPSNAVHAEVDFLEFHNTKGTLQNGTYRVVEADGDISYAVLGDLRGTLWFDIKWFTEAEYESAIQEQAYNQSQDDALDAIMRSADGIDEDDREELMNSWNEALVDKAQKLTSEWLDNHDGAYVEIQEPKTLGELLREAMATPDPELNEPTLQGECRKFLNAGVSDPVRDESGDCYLLRGYNA